MSTEDPTASVARLRKVGKKVPRAVRTEVLAHGPRAVGPLVALLTEGGTASGHAAELLAALRATEALPALLAALAVGPDEALAQRLGEALGAFGPAVVEPALEALGVVEAADAREALLGALVRSGVRDDRILAALLDAVERGSPEHAATVAGGYGDPRVAERLEALFQAAAPTDAASAERVVALGMGLVAARRFTEAHEPKMTAAYGFLRADLQQRIEELQAEEGAPPLDPGAGLFDAGQDLLPDDEAYDPGRALGRNDPCWCGSGKKLKRCHEGRPDDGA